MLDIPEDSRPVTFSCITSSGIIFLNPIWPNNKLFSLIQIQQSITRVYLYKQNNMKSKTKSKTTLESLIRQIAISDMINEGTNTLFLNFNKPITNTLKLA